MMIKLNSVAVSVAPRFALLISTQCYENYAWDADGVLDTENPYWKAKGGCDYLVTCSSLDEYSTALEQAIILDRVRDEIECDNGAYIEAIIGWRIVPAGFDPAVGVEDDPQLVNWLRDRLIRMAA